MNIFLERFCLYDILSIGNQEGSHGKGYFCKVTLRMVRPAGGIFFEVDGHSMRSGMNLRTFHLLTSN